MDPTPRHVEAGPAASSTEGEPACLELRGILADFYEANDLLELLKKIFDTEWSRICEWLMKFNQHLGCTPAELVRAHKFDLVLEALADYPP